MTDLNDLKGIARLKLDDGKAEEFKRLAQECMETIRAEDTGTLQYDIYLAEDGTECIFIERYTDSAALLDHNAHLGDKLGAMLGTGSVTAELLGDPSPELRAMVEGAPVRIFTPFLSL